MISIGTLLYFAPPKYASGVENIEHKKRIMVVVDINLKDNTLLLINISSVKGKARCFTYKYNYLIKNFNPPLPIESFAKLNDNYIIENNILINNYVYNNGTKLNESELINIIIEKADYAEKNKIEQIKFTYLEIEYFNSKLIST
ncbi:MAG: hypothetical protein RSB41_01120 [Bacilli bacterium]